MIQAHCPAISGRIMGEISRLLNNEGVFTTLWGNQRGITAFLTPLICLQLARRRRVTKGTAALWAASHTVVIKLHLQWLHWFLSRCPRCARSDTKLAIGCKNLNAASCGSGWEGPARRSTAVAFFLQLFVFTRCGKSHVLMTLNYRTAFFFSFCFSGRCDFTHQQGGHTWDGQVDLTQAHCFLRGSTASETATLHW